MHVQSNGVWLGGWLGGRLADWLAGRPAETLPPPPPPDWLAQLRSNELAATKSASTLSCPQQFTKTKFRNGASTIPECSSTVHCN